MQENFRSHGDGSASDPRGRIGSHGERLRAFAPLCSRSTLCLYAPAARGYGATLSAPKGLRSREGLCASPLCLKAALLVPLCASSAFLRSFGGCSALRPALRSGVVLPSGIASPLRYATPGMARYARYAVLRYAPGLRSCPPYAAPPPMRSAWAYSLRYRRFACKAFLLCSGVVTRLCA